jgi:hypothetical protein
MGHCSIPYDYNIRNIRKMIGVEGEMPAIKMRNLWLEIEFSTGHILREKVPKHGVAELSRYSELESRQI